MIDNNLKKLEKEVWAYVETLRNIPEARLKSRKTFYQKYGQGDKSEKYGYGDSEIAFFGWEDRGVLEPPTATPPGSAWWSEVNLWFIYLSELGAKAYEVNFPKSQLPVPAQFWRTFIEKPESGNWYRAHNTSIIDGYHKYPYLAERETIPEKIFINIVLYRLLYAQSMVDGQTIFPRFFKMLSNPKGAAVRFITHLDAYYPSHYPMTKEEIEDILGKTHNLAELGVKILDEVIIEPGLTKLYRVSSEWNQQPELNTFIVNNQPAYPYSIQLPETSNGLFIRVLIWLRKLFIKK